MVSLQYAYIERKDTEILAKMVSKKEQATSSGNNKNTPIDTTDETPQQPQPFPREKTKNSIHIR